MSEVLGLYSHIPAEPTGCFYYRVWVPFRGLQRYCRSEICIDQGKGMNTEQRAMTQISSDILLFYAMSGTGVEKTIELVKGMKSGMGSDGKTMEYPPSTVFDMDDNIDYVHPFNHTFVTMGTRNFDGSLLNPGDSLRVSFPDGTTEMLWEDRITVRDGVEFNIEKNHAHLQSAHKTARMCDGVTVPGPVMRDYYRDVIGCNNVYIFPNSVIPEDYPKTKLAPREDGSVRILWQGGGSHMPDWFPLRDAVREVCLRYPQVKFVIWGQDFPWIHDNIPDAQFEFVPWIGYAGYKAHRTLVDADINLCPLVDNIFNRSKSCIKWYEASILEKPEATLASRVRPYSDEMVDGETGLLYDDPSDFVQKLGMLIENAELRARLAENAKRWVMENRHIEKTVPGLYEFYQELRARKRAESLLEVA